MAGSQFGNYRSRGDYLRPLMWTGGRIFYWKRPKITDLFGARVQQIAMEMKLSEAHVKAHLHTIRNLGGPLVLPGTPRLCPEIEDIRTKCTKSPILLENARFLVTKEAIISELCLQNFADLTANFSTSLVKLPNPDFMSHAMQQSLKFDALDVEERKQWPLPVEYILEHVAKDMVTKIDGGDEKRTRPIASPGTCPNVDPGAGLCILKVPDGVDISPVFVRARDKFNASLVRSVTVPPRIGGLLPTM